jgi:hypothetical protein
MFIKISAGNIIAELRRNINVEYLKMANREQLLLLGINEGIMKVTQHK